MSESFKKDQYRERRKYPRKKARCPMSYFTRTTGNWSEARLEDYSAGGICFISGELLDCDDRITIQVSEDMDRKIPAMAASAVVLRCVAEKGSEYRVACQFTRVQRENPSRISRLGIA